MIFRESSESIASGLKKSTQESSHKLNPEERKNFEDLMLLRKQFIQQQCQSLKGNETFTESYDVEVYLPEYNFLYCPIHKASSTTWYQNLMILWIQKHHFQRFPDSTYTWEEWHLKIQKIAPRFQNLTHFKNSIKDPIKFAVVRHPFHRLVSAFRNKFETRHAWFYKQYGDEIMKKYGYLTKERPKYKGRLPLVTFEEFVKWIIDTNPDDMNK